MKGLDLKICRSIIDYFSTFSAVSLKPYPAAKNPEEQLL